MKIIKRNGIFYLELSKNSTVEIERNSDFSLHDVVKIGSSYQQVVAIKDQHNSMLPKGVTGYILEPINTEQLIEQAYHPFKI